MEWIKSCLALFRKEDPDLLSTEERQKIAVLRMKRFEKKNPLRKRKVIEYREDKNHDTLMRDWLS